jgi:hypothetical protein
MVRTTRSTFSRKEFKESRAKRTVNVEKDLVYDSVGKSSHVSEAKGREDVRYEHITLDGKFTFDRLRLKFAIDLDDLLRDIGVLGIGKWDANGA